MLEVEYIEPDHTDGPRIDSVRILGMDYKAIGPNLMPMLDKMFFLIGEGEGTLFLSSVAEELAA